MKTVNNVTVQNGGFKVDKNPDRAAFENNQDTAKQVAAGNAPKTMQQLDRIESMLSYLIQKEDWQS